MMQREGAWKGCDSPVNENKDAGSTKMSSGACPQEQQGRWQLSSRNETGWGLE